jgi:hypothetical protein
LNATIASVEAGSMRTIVKLRAGRFQAGDDRVRAVNIVARSLY